MHRHLPIGEFRHLIAAETLRRLRQAILQAPAPAGSGFVPTWPSGLTVPRSTAEMVGAVEMLALMSSCTAGPPEPLAKASVSIAREALTADGSSALLDLWARLMDLHGVADLGNSDGFVIERQGDEIHIQALEQGDDSQGVPQWAFDRDHDDRRFVASVANLIALVRASPRAMTRDECVAVAAAQRLLERGVRLPPSYASVGLSGFRRHQTCLSIANPGEGHVAVTTSEARFLDGVIVHIEHIDRDGESDRERVEPYRMPSMLDAARVRLHVGSAAPCSAYVGRPMFEGGVAERGRELGLSARTSVAFEQDLLKTAHLTAASCSALFSIGIAECKIAIERMSACEAIRFMRAVSANAMRSRTRQMFSAAFNLHIPLWDDRPGANRWLRTPLEIAHAGVEMAVEAGFGKVTWDGACHQIPSEPVIDLFPARTWVDLVHVAHARGLETYASAGLRTSDVARCVAVGFDAIGIGTSLHHRDPRTDTIGQLRADSIREALEARDLAERSALGVGARLLARLDRQAFEGTLPLALDRRRIELLDAMRAQDERNVRDLTAEIGAPEWADLSEPAIVQQARRMIESAGSHPSGVDRMGEEAWIARVRMVARMLEARDLTGMIELLG